MGKASILIADDEDGVRELFNEICKDENYNVILATNGLEAVQKAKEELPDVIILDIRMPGIDGLEAFRKIKESLINVPVLFITAFGSPDLAIEAMKEGAYNYITKPFDIDEIKILIRKAVQLRELTKRAKPYISNTHDTSIEIELLGHSNLMQEIYKMIGKISESNAPILLEGESGTGKEHIARKIHSLGRLKDQPFIIINCNCANDQSKEALEINKISSNSETTYYLKNIDSLSLISQSQLAEIIKNNNSNRIIAGTTIDLFSLVSKNQFNEDLYYTLRVMYITIPPLRQRKEDLEELSIYFLKKQGMKYGKILNGFTDDALMIIKDYDWPGNLDELENVITHAIIVSNGNFITSEDLGTIVSKITKNKNSLTNLQNNSTLSLSEAVKQFEKELILDALSKTNWNKTKTAEILGISRRSLFNKMRDFRLLKDENNEP
ncbi:MAG: sigma-54-dependent Fis family transcriptional regulator [Caldisericia bacterium]|nr:sigma-54-dependent Fis family transcriptional regulator [Caldisericia bacterium]